MALSSRERPNVTHAALSGFAWLLSGSGLQAILRTIVLVVLARLVAPSEFGVMGAALVVLGFSDLFYQLGVGPAIIQRAELEDRHIDSAFTGSLVLGLVLGAAVYLTAPLIETFFGFDSLASVLRVVSVSFPMRSLAVVSTALIARELQFRKQTFIEVTSYAIGYGLTGTAMAFAGFGVWALVAATLGQQAVFTILMVTTRRHAMRFRFDRAAFADLLRFGGGFTIARVFNYVALQGDNVVAGRMLGSAALGLYGRAYQLLVFPVNLISSALDSVLFPTMAMIQNDPRRLSAAFLRGTVAIALVFLPISAVAVVLAPELVVTLLGRQWLGAVAPFQILAAGMVFRASYKMSDSLARATGAVYRRAWRQAIYAAIVIAGSAIGQQWGLSGLSLGVLVALITNFTLMSHLSLRLTSMSARRFLAAHIPALGVGTGVLLPCWAIATWLRSIPTPALVTLAVSAVVPCGIVIALLAWRRNLVGADGEWIVSTSINFMARRMRP